MGDPVVDAVGHTTLPIERRVRLLGIGTGHPDHLTAEVSRALRGVDYVVAAAKARDDGSPDPLLAVRSALCDLHGVPLVEVPDPPRDRDDPADYRGAVTDWHSARAAAYERVLLERPGDVAFLVWGDPAFYDSTIRIVDQVLARGRVFFTHDVLPGVSAPQLLAARHRIVLHDVGRPVLVTTGRRLPEAVAAGADNIVVMLDGGLACRGLEGEWRVWWGANLGTEEEVLIAGRLRDVLPRIEAARADLRARAGWVMDTYLVRAG